VQARTLEEQRSFFDEIVAPLFDRRLVRWIVNRPVALFGLGIPPAQFEALGACGSQGMASILRQRLERLACDFAFDDNYFAHQAFGRRYPGAEGGPVPPYLHSANYEAVRSRAGRVDVRQMAFTAFLKSQKDASVDRFVLLDAQDWMTSEALTDLWSEITRTARRGARVIFRTAAEPSLLPGRVADDILARWDYHAGRSKALGQRDRSSIYGGFHLYTLREA
jgi:S-adenosylmethionine-diacylglycerol 3-amino-3-carboxypropyl transferase